MHRRLGISLLLAFVLFIVVAYYCIHSEYPEEAELKLQTYRPPQTVLDGVGYSMKETPRMTPPLRTAGRHIVDANGQRLKLASVNWYGASDVMFVPMGLDFRHRTEIAATIREMGFNSVRFPYSDQMVIENPVVDPVHLGANLDLLDGYNISAEGMSGPRALDVYKACVDTMTDAGIAVIINDHITNAHWCDGKNLCDASWKNDHYGPVCSVKQTTESWINNWKTIMEPYVNNPLVIGADLRNEPRGIWGTMTWNMWATAAEKAGDALHRMQPDWLIFVEGISSANDCSGARLRPVKLNVPDKVVYSSHVYSWSGWGTLVPYSKRQYPSFALDMERNWGYLLRENIAPVWVGEFGTTHKATPGARNYWNNLMRYLQEVDADWGYWALNPHKPAQYGTETYGLLLDDWITTQEDWRWSDLKKMMPILG